MKMNNVSKFILIILIMIMISIIATASYSPPSYDDINLTFNTGYVVQTYDDINLTFGETLDTCSPSGNENHVMSCSDYCNITTDLDMGGYNLTFNENGTITFDANLSNVNVLKNDGSVQDCYQESANVSTTCGGLDTGVYNVTITSGSVTDASNWNDGDWDTFAAAVGNSTPNEGEINFYVNYTKPENSTSSSLWEIKYGHSPTHTNYSIPLECWNQAILQFKVWSYYRTPADIGFSDVRNKGSCYNGSDWDEIYYEATEFADTERIYEEAMWWNDGDLTGCIVIFNQNMN